VNVQSPASAPTPDVLMLPASSIVPSNEPVSKPVNVLARPKLALSEIFEAGAQRVSLGGSLAFLAVSAMAGAAETIRDDGDFTSITLGPKLGEWLSSLG